MPKIKDDRVVLDLLTPGERDLIQMTREAEYFTVWGYERYGEDWPSHVPTLLNAEEWASPELFKRIGRYVDGADSARPVVNAFTRWFFGGFRFQRHQVLMHYSPIPDIQIMGGVGSGKTTPTTISAATRLTINPSYRVLWVAPILSQAKLAYDVVMQWGANSRWGKVFLKDYRRHPYPLITLRPWDKFDIGSEMECRSLGQDPAEMLRGGEYDEGIADEAMRAFVTDWYIALISGRLRGARPYMLARYADLREEYSDRVEEIEWEEDGELRELLRKELESWVKQSGVARQTRLTVIGNAPRGAAWWRRWEYGLKNPGERFSARWSTRQNLYVTREQLELQAKQFRGREEEMTVELDAMRPPAGGDVFPTLDNMFNGELMAEAVQSVADRKSGWVIKSHEEFGIYHYEKPVDRNAAYAFALDPGSGIIAARNQWVLLGVRIDKGPHTDEGGPFEVVYFQAGNLPGAHGSPDPWIAAAKDVRQRYPMAADMFAVESSGVQKNTFQVIWPDDLVLTPIFLNNVMNTLIIEAQRTVGADMWHVPDCPIWVSEMAEFRYVMKKDEPQDWVCAFLILNHLVYPLVHQYWEITEPEEEEEYLQTFENKREVRDSRNVRDRR